MASAWLLKPLPITGAVTTAGTLQKGAGEFAFNDYAGVVCQLACDAGGTASLTFDLGAVREVDTLMVFGVELMAAGGAVAVSYSTTGGAFTQVATAPAYAGAVMPVSGRGVSIAAFPGVTARYWRVTYGGGAAVRLARIAIGKRIQLERNFDFGAAFGVRDLGSLDFSPRGVLLRRRAKKLRTVALTFSNVRKDEVEASTKPLLEEVGNTESVAILTDPAEDAHRQNRAYLGPLVGDLSQVWAKANGFQVKANVVSLF